MKKKKKNKIGEIIPHYGQKLLPARESIVLKISSFENGLVIKKSTPSCFAFSLSDKLSWAVIITTLLKEIFFLFAGYS
jgi:hypothetical protein